LKSVSKKILDGYYNHHQARNYFKREKEARETKTLLGGRARCGEGGPKMKESLRAATEHYGKGRITFRQRENSYLMHIHRSPYYGASEVGTDNNCVSLKRSK